MKKNLKKIVIFILIVSINIIINISFAQPAHWQAWDAAAWWGWNVWVSQMNFLDKTNIYNKNIDKAIAPIEQDPDHDGSILHIWSHRIFGIWWDEGVEWIVWTDEEFDNYNEALTKILTVIQNIVNYTLWLLWVISVIYLLIHGFMILTAAWDDSRTKKWLKWIKNAFIAIAWIWLSWIIISFILRLINTFTS